MRRLRAWILRLAGLATARRRAKQFDAELQSHLELHVEENIRRGMTPEDARRHALIALGGTQVLREAYHDRGGVPTLDTLGQDIRFAVRVLRKSPGFTITAVVILAIGIGANASLFSLINGALLRPIVGTGVDDRLVGVYSGERTRPDAFRPFSYPEYVDLRDRNDVFTHVIAEAGVRTGITEGGETRRVSTMLVSSNYFAALEVPMLAGRAFTREEEHPLADAAVLVVSPALARHYGSAQNAIGRRVVLNAREFTIVGVAPEWFRGTMPILTSELWAPFGAARLLVPADQRGYIVPASLDRATPALLLGGTLKPDVSAAEAQARLAPLADAMAAAYPEFNTDQRLVVQTRSRTARGAAPRSDGGALTGAAVLMAIAGMVLGVACLNLANMLLARGSERRQEIAVRLALGGGRFRIVRQLIIEGLILATFASAAALAVAWWAASLFVTAVSRLVPTAIFLDISPDGRVIAVVAAAAVVSTVIFSLGPAWRLSKPELSTALKPSMPFVAIGGRARGAARIPLTSLLVAAQIAFSVTLLVSAGVFVRHAARAAAINPGFPVEGRLIAEMDAALAGTDTVQARAKYDALLSRVRELAGVRDATLASHIPFGDRGGRLVRADDTTLFAGLTVIGSNYFSTIGLPIAAGRDFTEETSRPSPVAIVDRVFAERVFPGANPLGRVVHFVDPEGGVDDSLEIVGVVPTVHDDPMEAPRPHVYVPFRRTFRVGMTLLASVEPGSEARMLEEIRRAIAAEAEPLPMISIRTLADHRDRSPRLWTVVYAARVFVIFGLVALALATAGVYGLRAYLVARKTREIGIRLALGATPSRLVQQLLREGAGIAAAGVAAGLLLAVGVVQVLQSGLEMGTGRFDLIAFAAAAVVSALATIAASSIPARRALRIDPATALRPE